MRNFLIGAILLMSNLACLTQANGSTMKDNNWMIKAQRVDEEAIQWLKEHLKERLIAENLLTNPLNSNTSTIQREDCSSCGFDSQLLDESFSLYVFMSFTLEDTLWIQFSKELEKIGGIFVLRGLPQNSFKELANRIFELQEKGVTVPIQIHPQLFQQYEVLLVPTIVVVEENRHDKISGTLSIKGALEKMSSRGETNQAKALYQRWKNWEKS